MQRRLESSPTGRLLITAFVVVSLVFVVADNLPNSRLRTDVLKPGRAYLNALGLDQSWALFAPQPRRDAIDIEAVVLQANGRVISWTIPRDDPVLGQLRDYRWRKWMENVIQDANGELWRPTASWIARREGAHGSPPVEVRLIRRFAALRPPGRSPDVAPWRSYVFFTLGLRR